MFHCSSEELCARVALIDSGYQVSIGVQIKNFYGILEMSRFVWMAGFSRWHKVAIEKSGCL